MSVSSSEAVQQIDTLGQSQYEDYKEVVLENRTCNLQTPIKKNKLIFKKIFLNRSSNAKQQPRKNYLIIHTGQLFVSLHSRQGDLSLFFEHESVVPPPAMKTTNDKAAPSKQDHTEQMAELPPTGYNAIIIDGGALIHTMPPTPSCSTFDDYVATVFYLRLFVELKACDRLDVIWDRYFLKSIKGSTRNKRANGVGGGTRQHIAGNARIPQGKNTWEKFLADSSNKKNFEFLSSESIKNQSYPDSSDVYLTSGAKVVHIGPGDELVEPSNHEKQTPE